MLSFNHICHHSGWMELSALLLFSLPAVGQGQYANHQRHVDSGNIHMWWDTNTSSALGNGGLAGIGDLNGDGHPEVLIGMPGSSSAIIGKVRIFSGREGTGILATLTATKAGGAFGYAIATIGDVNGDNIDDFIVASPNATVGKATQAGIVQLYSGKLVANKATLLRTFSGATNGGQFGLSVAGPGDVDGDGFPDIAIGEPGNAKLSGAVHVYSGNPKHAKGAYALIYRQAGLQVGERYGHAISGAGDVTSDKRSDVIVGAPLWNGPGGSNHGRAEVLAWTGTTAPRIVQLTAGRGIRAGDNYGWSVDGVGIIEGSARVIVGAPNDSSKAKNAGMASVVAPGKPWVKSFNLLGNSAGDRLGYCVVGCGDTDHDGIADFAASAPWDDPISGTEDSGSLFIYGYSAKTKLVKQIGHRVHSASYYTGQNCKRRRGLTYGVRLAAVGDIDQDDHTDFLVGCDWWYVKYSSFGRCGSLARYHRRVYLDSPIKQTLYASTGHAIVSKAKGSTSVIYSLQAGKAYANQLMLFMGTGPNNTNRPVSCGIKLGTKCIPVNMASPWFPLALSGTLHPFVAAVGPLGNASVTLSLPPWKGPPLPLKIYYVGLLFKFPAPSLVPTHVTNNLPIWIR